MAYDTAMLMLPNAELVKVKMITGPSRIGNAVLELDQVQRLIARHGCVKAASEAVKQGYGLELLGDGQTGSVLFIETRRGL